MLMSNKIYLYDTERLAIPNDKALNTRLLQEHHDIPISEHLDIDKTYEQLQRHYYWPNMSKDIRKYILSCEECQRNKSTNQSSSDFLQLLNIPNN